MVSLLISPVIRLMNSKMTKTDYLKLLVDEIHSTTVATIGADGHPQTRIIDMMYYDKEGIYFLTAKGKEFYAQLMEQQYVAISATKEKIAISLRGKVQNIGKKNLDIMFEKNPYMKEIYPEIQEKQPKYSGCDKSEALSSLRKMCTKPVLSSVLRKRG